MSDYLNTNAHLEGLLSMRDAEIATLNEKLSETEDFCTIEMTRSSDRNRKLRNEIATLREQVKMLRDAEPIGAVLVDRESREGVMFYSNDMIPDPATIKDRFELIKVYEALAATEPVK